MRLLVASCLAVCGGLLGPGGVSAQSIHEGVDFDAQILPTLEDRCGCHLGTQESGVEVTSYETLIGSVGNLYGRPVVTPFDGLGSPIRDVIVNEPPEFGRSMPPVSTPLSPEEIELIVAWIDQGARSTPTRSVLRGDMNGSLDVDLSDAVTLLSFLFGDGQAPQCEPVADSNNDGGVDITDAIYILSFLFQGGPGLDPLTPEGRRECIEGAV